MVHTLGKYIISDKPMSEEDWIRERATMIDVEATEVIEDKSVPSVHPKTGGGDKGR